MLAEVDLERRASVSRSHSATHLLHAGLRRALGDTAAQAGSLNAPGRLRFDFTTPSAVPHSVLGDVEDEINEVLLRDLEVRWFVTDQDEARRLGAIAMFGEKYGDRVRIVEIGDYSRELCGGTHVPRSSVIGMVKLLGESSIGSGVRRVEALVGLDAFRYLAREHVLVQSLASEFKAQPDELPERIAGVLDRLKGAERELAKLRVGAGARQRRARWRQAAEDVDGVQLVAAQAPAGVGGNDLRSLALDVRGRLRAGDPAVVLLASPADGGGCGVRRGGQRRRPGGRARGGRAGARVRARARRPRRRQGRPRPGRRRRRRPSSRDGLRRGQVRRRAPIADRAMTRHADRERGLVRRRRRARSGSGVARSDPAGILASPLVDAGPRSGAATPTSPSWPRWSPSTRRSAWSSGCRDAARPGGRVGGDGPRATPSGSPQRIAPVPVRHVDERLTTVSAQRKLHQSGVRGSRGSGPSSTRLRPSSCCNTGSM